MGRQLGIKEQMYGRASGDLPQPRHPISFASHRKRIFCKPCNTHFKHLEDKVIPLIVPMATGRSIVALGPETREMLALWASKTAMALLAAHDLHDLVPQEHRDAIRYQGVPSPWSWVGYFKWAGGPNLYLAQSDLATARPYPAGMGETYTAVLSFRELAFSMVGFVDPIPPGFGISSGHHPIIQFWPRRAAIGYWPPEGEPANAAAIEDIARFTPLVPIQ
jgi:hypothetical protein